MADVIGERKGSTFATPDMVAKVVIEAQEEGRELFPHGGCVFIDPATGNVITDLLCVSWDFPLPGDAWAKGVGVDVHRIDEWGRRMVGERATDLPHALSAALRRAVERGLFGDAAADDER